ncbi:MAG: VWA domain-containing protein [Micropruina sp.]
MALDIRNDDLVENPTPRVPVSLCIDTSGSMMGDKIRELIEGIKLFYDAIDEDDDAHDSAEVSVVAFNSGANVVQDFASIEGLRRDIAITPSGLTHLGEGVNLALDTLEKRKALYSNSGVLYYQPWLVLMTDGQPNGDRQMLERAVERVASLVGDKKLTVFPIGIGADADMNVLGRFRQPPLRLEGLSFREFFEWLSKSVSKVSQSMPGGEPPIDFRSIRGIEDL